jgi:hypothetical protein
MAAKLTRLTHKIAIKLYLVAQRCTICSSRSQRPVRNILDTSWYTSNSFATFFAVRKYLEPLTFHVPHIIYIFHCWCFKRPSTSMTLCKILHQADSFTMKCFYHVVQHQRWRVTTSRLLATASIQYVRSSPPNLEDEFSIRKPRKQLDLMTGTHRTFVTFLNSLYRKCSGFE